MEAGDLLAAGEGDAFGVLHFEFADVAHDFGEFSGADDGEEFEVDVEGAGVEVAGADEGVEVVDHHGLGVEHLLAAFVDSKAAADEFVVEGGGGALDDGDVGFSGDDDADAGAAASGGEEGAEGFSGGEEVGHGDGDLVLGGADEAGEDAGGAGIFEAGARIEEANGFGEVVGVVRVAVEVECTAVGAGAAWDGFTVGAAPGAVEGFGEFGLVRAFEADVDVAPAGGGGAVFFLLLFDVFDVVDDVHAAEVADGVVDDHEFSVVAAVKEGEGAEAAEAFPEGVEGVDRDAGGDEVIEEGVGGGVGAEGVIEEADVEAFAGLLFERVGDAGGAVVVVEDVDFDPDAVPGVADVAFHGIEERR